MSDPAEDTQEVFLDKVIHVHVPGFKGILDDNAIASITTNPIQNNEVHVAAGNDDDADVALRGNASSHP